MEKFFLERPASMAWILQGAVAFRGGSHCELKATRIDRGSQSDDSPAFGTRQVLVSRKSLNLSSIDLPLEALW